MADIQPIKITGLAEFNRNLRKLDKDLPKALRLALNEAGEIVVAWAKPQVPVQSGKAVGTVKARSTRTSARVTGGSAKVPYYPWLDFGGRVGRNKSVKRPWQSAGRYIYPGYTSNVDKIHEALIDALLDVARQAGIEVDR